MEKLHNQLEALMHRKGLQEIGITRPYMIEWEFVSFPEKNKPLKLEIYDRKGFRNQHIYYFLPQTDHLMGNDSVITKIFTSILRGTAFT